MFVRFVSPDSALRTSNSALKSTAYVEIAPARPNARPGRFVRIGFYARALEAWGFADRPADISVASAPLPVTLYFVSYDTESLTPPRKVPLKRYGMLFNRPER